MPVPSWRSDEISAIHGSATPYFVELSQFGLPFSITATTHHSASALIETALARGEGYLTDRGALVTRTGERTGRSPKDRYIVEEPGTCDKVAWGTVNRPISEKTFNRLLTKVGDHLRSGDAFASDLFACSDPKRRLSVRVVADQAWHAQFANIMLIEPTEEDRVGFVPELTVLVAGKLRVDPERFGIRSEAFVVLHLQRGLVLIGGTEYAGEIKKSVFSYLNYHLPESGVLPMHCSANIGESGDTALFFGLSGTGKTTLSADPNRKLIGDDEHGWSDEGIFNIEGGCYAKCIGLTREQEPQIWDALHFGAILENVDVDPATRRPNYADRSVTENTRAAYPLAHVSAMEPTSRGDHPKNVIFLTCDAFGVMPPLSRLTSDQALYHFLCGYTAKVAGTEAGVTKPQAVFSACFGEPFLPLAPVRYAEMLREKITRHGSNVWLVNTGWTGGPPGQGERIKLGYTRAMIDAILNGQLADVAHSIDPVFQLHVPDKCPNVPTKLLQPRNSWADQTAYEAQARELVALYASAISRYHDDLDDSILSAGPRLN